MFSPSFSSAVLLKRLLSLNNYMFFCYKSSDSKLLYTKSKQTIIVADVIIAADLRFLEVLNRGKYIGKEIRKVPSVLNSIAPKGSDTVSLVELTKQK